MFHTEQCHKRADETCDWITNSSGWSEWWNGGSLRPGGWRRFAWIYGIPGAGKTVLASFLIDDVAKRCESTGFSYYYCSHERNRDETIPFLSRIIEDLSRQLKRYIPKELEQLHESRIVTVRGLLNCFLAISRQFERDDRRVYVLVDAVDESKMPRRQLLEVLITIGLHPSFQNVSLLMTSREEEDIVEAMKARDMVDEYRFNVGDMEIDDLEDSCPYTSITLSNCQVMQAIRTYARKQLNTNTKFRRWESAFRDRVEDELARQARGMFRWVACQIDIIERIYNHGQEEILATIKNMPDTLFGTYERILENIPRENRAFARTALALICSNTSEIPSADVLVQASLHEVHHGLMHMYNVTVLREILGCLIKVTKLKRKPYSSYPRDNEGISFARVDVAHYTVKEFLFAPSTTNGKAKDFALSPSTTKALEMQVIFNGLQQFEPTRPRKIPTRYEEYCLKMTQQALLKQRGFILQEENVWKVVVPCLTPSSLHLKALTNQSHQKVFPEWAKLIGITEPPVDAENDESRPRKMQPQTGILASLLLLNWPEFAQKYLESGHNQTLPARKKDAIWTDKFVTNKIKTPQTLLRLCVSLKHIAFLEHFIQAGATFNNEPDIIFIALHNPYGENDRDGTITGKLIKLLLLNGAESNPPGYKYTPLQDAVHHLEESWVQALLREGRCANQVGDPDGEYPYGCDQDEEWHSHHPLRVCRDATVKEGGTDDELYMSKGLVKELLEQYGAHEPADRMKIPVIDLID
ncbi:hypothetical protein F5B20DRAFT_35383 [Whalleya microplaca]|nr:hypothetical protein F5B20DRAFT_35383 [Whalleya microplaca]